MGRFAMVLWLMVKHLPHCYGPGSSPSCCSLGLTPCHMWDVFYISQPNAWWFSLRGFLQLLKGLEIVLILIGTVDLGNIKHGFVVYFYCLRFSG